MAPRRERRKAARRKGILQPAAVQEIKLKRQPLLNHRLKVTKRRAAASRFNRPVDLGFRFNTHWSDAAAPLCTSQLFLSLLFLFLSSEVRTENSYQDHTSPLFVFSFSCGLFSCFLLILQRAFFMCWDFFYSEKQLKFHCPLNQRHDSREQAVWSSKAEWNVRMDDVILGPSDGQWRLLAALLF